MKGTPSTAELVEAARDGELDAFARLVESHRRGAFGYALAQLGHPEAAEDAVQEAFLEAFRKLGQLREPAAFGGWLRRIVYKHCDRQRRRRVEQPGVVEREAAPAPSPEEGLDARARQLAALALCETLPEHERLPVALHYLAGLPLREVGDLLELPVSTLKKRLFSARRRLRSRDERSDTMIERALSLIPQRPLEAHIGLFLAVRASDRDAVRRILRDHPELLEAKERWTDEEALAGGFSLAHPLTPLVLAASHGDLPMVDLLLGLGASPDGACGCATGESALWAAARGGHGAVVDRLLEAGADPSVCTERGTSLDDLARWRRPGAFRSHAGVVDGVVSFGIKALDLWLPLRPGAVIRVQGAAETGLMVLMTELAAAVGHAGGASVWSSWAPRPWQREELAVIAARGGVERDVHLATASAPEARSAVLERALQRAEALRDEHPLVVHVVFGQEGHATDVAAALPRLRGSATATFVVDPWAAVTRGDLDPPAAQGPFDGALVTDGALAARGRWPAIDARRTGVADPDARSAALAARARAALADGASPRAERLTAYLTQPFHAATPDTGWPGVSVPRPRTLADVAAILDGDADRWPAEDLLYRGGLPASSST